VKAVVSTGSVQDFKTIVLENDFVRAVIIPALGGRVWELEDRQRGRQWIWHRANVPLQENSVGAVYDDVWAGGWEELFPNDAPGQFENRLLPDHGEWWTSSWSATDVSDASGAAVRLSTTTSIVKASCSKEFRLANDSTLSVLYKITSQEPEAFHYLLKQHLPISVTQHCRLALPGGRMRTVDPSFSTIVGDSNPFEWPIARGLDRDIDMREVLDDSSKTKEFLYAQDLPEGWCGIDDLQESASIRMQFDRQAHPFVWLFLSYGGWQDLYTAVLEPCTNMPKDLAEAVRLGQSAMLEPGQDFETRVSIKLGGLEEKAA
jgi:hypothetical protein